MEEHNNYAVDFFNATKVIKETCPYAKISYLRLALPHTDACQASRTERKRAGLAATAAAHCAALRRAANTSIDHATWAGLANGVPQHTGHSPSLMLRGGACLSAPGSLCGLA